MKRRGATHRDATQHRGLLPECVGNSAQISGQLTPVVGLRIERGFAATVAAGVVADQAQVTGERLPVEEPSRVLLVHAAHQAVPPDEGQSLTDVPYGKIDVAHSHVANGSAR